MATENHEDIEKIYNLVHSLVIKAGQVMRTGYYGRTKDVHAKTAFYDLVTKYDKEIEDILINGISAVYPNHKFIGEEESAAAAAAAKSSGTENVVNERELTNDPTWIIDPIDGTTNFIKNVPHACISIAMTINKILVIGIIYNPIINELYTAKKGQGAYMNGERIRVSPCKNINKAVIAYEISLIHAPRVRDKNVKRLYQMASNATGTRSFGSAALTLCYIANGSIDCYHVEDLKSWDIAAGAIILQEAGGVIYHTSGKEFDIMHPDLVCASTNELCSEIIELIGKANQMNHVTFERDLVN